MMNKHHLAGLLLLCLCTSFTLTYSKFPESKQAFIKELGTYIMAAKKESATKTFKRFEQHFKSGAFDEGETKQIMEVCNRMLEKKLAAHPYFTDYLTVLSEFKNSKNEKEKLLEWNQVIYQMLGQLEKRPFKTFLQFSIHFFEKQSLHYSPKGSSWYFKEADYQLRFEEQQPLIHFDQVDIYAARKDQQLLIAATAGTHYPLKRSWQGEGGKVQWEQQGMENVYSELSTYELDVSKTRYEAENAQLYYPDLFGDQAITGHLVDKLVVKGKGKESSYPRFESTEGPLTIEGIGAGLVYKGGFRLHGRTVNGAGTDEQKAELLAYKANGELAFRSRARAFSIQQGDRITGEQVETILYAYGQDSIYHPSVQFKYVPEEHFLQLQRGKRGSDRNPFYDSYHGVNIETEKIDWYLEADSIVFNRKNAAIGNGQYKVAFESDAYFNVQHYRKLQNVADYNPIASLRALSLREKSQIIKAEQW
ncbi:MAG: hypothetical protein AAFP19_12270, partial [Bacteroidota bacterium]